MSAERDQGAVGPAANSPSAPAYTSYPKIELHVHLEATVAPATLLEIARRNDYPLPVSTVEELLPSIGTATSTTSSRSGS